MYDSDFLPAVKMEKITVSRYVNTNISLNQGLTLEGVFSKNDQHDREFYMPLVKEDYDNFGDIALYFWNEGQGYLNEKEFDVDGDGQNEKIYTACGYGGNHCPHVAIIVKDNKIIFESSEERPSIVMSDDNQGFILEWIDTNTQLENGWCCPTGKMRTKFVFENGRFTPIWEEKVDFLLISRD